MPLSNVPRQEWLVSGSDRDGSPRCSDPTIVRPSRRAMGFGIGVAVFGLGFATLGVISILVQANVGTDGWVAAGVLLSLFFLGLLGYIRRLARRR